MCCALGCGSWTETFRNELVMKLLGLYLAVKYWSIRITEQYDVQP